MDRRPDNPENDDLSSRVLLSLLEELNAEVEQRKQAEALLRVANEELELRVEERTADLAEARDAAQAASRAKGEFLANMSHEIRTPLNAVIGLTEVVLRSELDDLQRDQLATVMDSAESLLSVIEDILDFSKVEAGKLELEQVKFDLHDTIGDTLKSLSIRAQHKKIELACYLDPEIPRILVGDPGRLRQVITNLVGNALKFTEDGEIVVRVEPLSIRPESVSLSIQVKDTGIGIDPSELERLFDSFEQVDTSTTRRFGGTGLGLAICKRLVALLGGEIEVQSDPGLGSTFRFSTRFGLPDEASHPDPISVDGLVGTPVLIVDDNNTNRHILDTITRRWGMRPVLADSAVSGLRSLEAAAQAGRPIPLLLSDVHMPDLDGFGFVAALRADPALAETQVVFLTSGGSPGDLKRCEDLGVAGRVMKPAKQAEILAVVRRALGLPAIEEGLLPVLPDSPEERVPPMRILLAEDSLANQKVAMAILEGQGHSIVIANNGREVLETLASADFDAILMDVQMPEVDGFAATTQIREEEANREEHVPIIAMTAHALQGDREKCLAVGMDDYISKPIRRGELATALARAASCTKTTTPEAPPGRKLGSSERRVDWSVPLSQVADNREVLRGIVESYAVEIRQQIELLPGRIEAEDTMEVRRLAHTLKGAMRMFGAGKAQRLAQQLEDLGAVGQLDTALGVLERAAEEAQKVLPELDAFIETGELPDDVGSDAAPPPPS